jgi:hypothetical protein
MSARVPNASPPTHTPAPPLHLQRMSLSGAAIAPEPGTSTAKSFGAKSFGDPWAVPSRRSSRVGTPLDGNSPGTAGLAAWLSAHPSDDHRASRNTAWADTSYGGASNPGLRDAVAMSAVAAYEQQRSTAAPTACGTWAQARQSTSGAASSPFTHSQPAQLLQSHSGIGSGGSPSTSPLQHARSQTSRVGALAAAEHPAGFLGSDPIGGPIGLGSPLMRWNTRNLSPHARGDSGELGFAKPRGARTRSKSVVDYVDGGGLSTPTKIAYARGLTAGTARFSMAGN